MTTIEQQVMDIEKGFWEKGTAEFFKNNFSDNGAAIMEPNGIVDKKQSVEMASDWRPYHDVKMEDIYTQQISPDVIAVSYHGEGKREGDDKPYRGRMTSIYSKKDGEWQLALAIHQTLEDAKK